jgi:hypothetical protein
MIRLKPYLGRPYRDAMAPDRSPRTRPVAARMTAGSVSPQDGKGVRWGVYRSRSTVANSRQPIEKTEDPSAPLCAPCAHTPAREDMGQDQGLERESNINCNDINVDRRTLHPPHGSNRGQNTKSRGAGFVMAKSL